jgi:MFS family permease
LMVGSSEKSTRGGSMGIYTTSRMFGFGIGPLLGGFLYDNFGFDSTFYAGTVFIILAIILVNLWVDEPHPKNSSDKPEKFSIIDKNILNTGILSVGFVTLIMAADFSMMTSLETQFNEKLGMSTFIFGLAFSAVLITRMFVQVPLGRFSDHIGRKPLIIGGMLLLVPSTALLGYANSTFILILLRLLQGLASAAVAAPAFAIVGDMAQAGGEGRQMSIITMGFGLGVALGPLLAGVLAIHSFALPFILGGLLSLVAAWIVYRFVPETVRV